MLNWDGKGEKDQGVKKKTWKEEIGCRFLVILVSIHEDFY